MKQTVVVIHKVNKRCGKSACVKKPFRVSIYTLNVSSNKWVLGGLAVVDYSRIIRRIESALDAWGKGYRPLRGKPTRPLEHPQVAPGATLGYNARGQLIKLYLLLTSEFNPSPFLRVKVMIRIADIHPNELSRGRAIKPK